MPEGTGKLVYWVIMQQMQFWWSDVGTFHHLHAKEILNKYIMLLTLTMNNQVPICTRYFYIHSDQWWTFLRYLTFSALNVLILKFKRTDKRSPLKDRIVDICKRSWHQTWIIRHPFCTLWNKDGQHQRWWTVCMYDYMLMQWCISPNSWHLWLFCLESTCFCFFLATATTGKPGK